MKKIKMNVDLVTYVSSINIQDKIFPTMKYVLLIVNNMFVL